MILDITDRKEFENNLGYINEHDRWTGLYNRDYLETVLEEDLHKKEDIKKAADTLNEYCNDKKMLFQTYENRFVFYIVDYKDKEELYSFSEQIADTLEELFITERVGGGIGIIEIDQNSELIDVDQLLRKLLIASGRSINIYEKDFRYCFYDDELEALVNKERDIRNALSAIANDKLTNDELFMQYQPIYDLRTNTITGFEALARLRIEDYGLISPIEFIPIAEKTKLIIPIGDQVIVKAFHFLNKLKKNGYDHIGISINISAIQLFRLDFSNRLFELIKEMNVDPNNIDIEITESIFSTDFDEINNIIEKLRQTGLRIAIDDFGTGYSSLAREKELNVDIMKIDKFFIDKLMIENLNTAITNDIISMAHKLGHTTIAEGVEHEEQVSYLKQHNCAKIQGYYISRPLDEEVAIEYLRDSEFHR